MKHIIALICLLISNFLVPPATAETEILDYIVAVVNDDVIVNSALQRELELVEEKWRKSQNNTRPLPPRKFLEKQVLDRMIITTLQLQVAQNTGIKINNSHLNAQLRQIAAQNQLDLQGFRDKMEEKGYSYMRLREQLRKDLIIKRLRQRQIVNRIQVTPREIDNFLANQTQQGTIADEYHLWHILIAVPAAPSPDDIEEKKQKAQEVFAKLKQGADFQDTAVAVSDSRQAVEGGDLGWLKKGELPTLFNDIIHKVAVGDIYGPIRDSNGFHIIKLVNKRSNTQTIITQTKMRHILIKTNKITSDQKAQNRLKRLKSRIEHGDNFAKLARTNSQDTTTSAKGGSLGWVSPGDLVPEFEAVMKNLPKKQISQPFKSRYGWHILQVLDRRKHDNTEKALRNKATRQIRQRKINEELQAWLLKLRDQSYIEYRLQNKTDS